MSHELKKVSEIEQVKKKGDQISRELQSKLDIIEKIQMPNMKAMQKLVTEKIATTNIAELSVLNFIVLS